jgi:DNA-directed RNA polymerase subunit RPC12/RpoP
VYSGSVCPRCSSRKIRRSKRKGFWERVILDRAGIRPYRCEECDERFLRSRSRDHDSNDCNGQAAFTPRI